ncbi:MAG: SH3 domain-containing protein [Chloroflexi bacterium]|nr:SH3 domain-containing protein [Chloroflexota bacterium]
MRRWTLVCVLLVVLIAPASGQADPFRAWLLHPDRGALTAIDTSGPLGTIALPVPDGFATVSPDEVAIAPDGQTAAYVVYRAGYVQPAVAVLRLSDQQLIANFAPQGMTFTSLGLAPRAAFSPDSRRLALGYMTDEGWELVVIDIAAFAIAARITDRDPQLGSVPRTPDSLPVPVDHRQGGTIGFTVYDLAVSRAASYPGFTWDTLTGNLAPSPAYATPFVDVYPGSGEVIRAGTDERLPRTEAFLPDAHHNVLMRVNPLTSETAPFYLSPEHTLLAPRFVRGGVWIAVGTTDGFSETWTLIDRAGQPVAGMPENQRIYDVAGTANGLLYVTLNSDAAPMAVSLDLAGEGAPAVLWTGTLSDLPPRILWAGSSDPTVLYWPDTLGAAAWSQLVEPLAPPPTLIAAGSVQDDALTIGGKATVATTNGDSLNVRSDAGTVYQIRAKARPGEVVDVLDGPRDADGFTWWEIRLTDGRQGWAVEEADGRRTLVPGVDSAPIEDEFAPANPVVSTGLAVGDTALVTLPDTLEALRLRNGAGLDFDIVLLLPTGTVLRIVDGPVEADDLTWWQVRTPEGNVGWAAEVIGSARVLTKQ